MKNKGITLIALVITIIVLLILAGITIQSITHTGILKNAKQAQLENKRGQISEYLKLKLINEQTNNPFGSAEEIITATRNNVIENIDDLKKIGKEVTIEETSTEEDGENVDIYFYVIVDKDVYKVELNDVTFIGEQGEFFPVIKLKSISNTTNTITVEVTTKRNQGGKLEYYIKSEDKEEYKLIKTTTEEKYTYEELEQGKKYNIKVIAVAENKKTVELIVEQTTGKIGDLTEANAKFTYSPSTWTNGNVIATVFTDVTGFIIQTSKDGNTWSNTTSQTMSVNGPVYARLWDGTNAGGMLAGNVTKIDKEAPKSFTPTTSSTTNSITVVANTTDQTKTPTNGESGMEGYRFSKDEGKTWTEWQTNGTYKFNDMLKDINGSTYNIVVQAKDKAQNITTSTIVQATTAKNMEYYINEKDKLLATILNDQDANTRLFFKDSSDGAIVAMAYTQVENSSPDGIKFDNFTWLHPILVSTTENGAKYYGDSRDEWYNQSMNDIYDFEYKGVKYYCSSMTGWVVMGYNNEFFSRYTTTFKTLNESTNPYKNGVSGPKEAGLALVKKYLGE